MGVAVAPLFAPWVSERPRPLALLVAELCALSCAVHAYAAQQCDVEEAQARADYRGLLCEICERRQLDPNHVYHPLLGAPERAPFRVSVLS